MISKTLGPAKPEPSKAITSLGMDEEPVAKEKPSIVLPKPCRPTLLGKVAGIAGVADVSKAEPALIQTSTNTSSQAVADPFALMLHPRFDGEVGGVAGVAEVGPPDTAESASGASGASEFGVMKKKAPIKSRGPHKQHGGLMPEPPTGATGTGLTPPTDGRVSFLPKETALNIRIHCF